MNIIGILVLIAAAIWVIVVVGSWLLGLLTSVLGGVASTAESGATSFFNFIGRKHLAQISTELLDYLPVPVDLLELENKLSSSDEERLILKNYNPSISSPGPLKVPQYDEELPKLFSRVGKSISLEVNIDHVRQLARISSEPAFELLKVVNDEQPPKFPYPALTPPKPIDPPKKWTPWSCKDHSYEVVKPLYSGIFTPLNYFVRRSFKKIIKRSKYS